MLKKLAGQYVRNHRSKGGIGTDKPPKTGMACRGNVSKRLEPLRSEENTTEKQAIGSNVGRTYNLLRREGECTVQPTKDLRTLPENRCANRVRRRTASGEGAKCTVKDAQRKGWEKMKGTGPSALPIRE